MKKTIKIILGLACALVLFASCSPGAVNFDIKIGELQYGSGKDKVHVEITSDNSNVNVRGSECWWTFDGSEPTEQSKYNNSDTTVTSYEFDMEIPSDFYSGEIKFLCKIKQAAMGKKKVVTKKITKNIVQSIILLDPELLVIYIKERDIRMNIIHQRFRLQELIHLL